MEARHKNGPKALSDEASSPEQATDGGGAAARAYYECVFCKRGFSNAQALGGHMNIHRKDRAKMRQPPPPPPTTSNLSMKSEEEFNLSKNYVMYFGREEVQMDSYRQPVQELSLFGADQELHAEGFVTGGGNEKEVVEEREVDLELRLGHQQP